MNTSRVLHLMVMVCLAVLVTAGCGHGGKDKQATQVSGAAAVAASSTAADYESALKAMVDDEIRGSSSSDASGHGQVLKKKPYFYKEYAVYPDGAGQYTFDIQETDSRTVPYRATVTMKKQRFATKLHRKRDDAQGDSNFLRDTGSETQSYELRGGRWWRTGSIFVAEVTEENVNGEWVPARIEVERTVPAEEKDGSWFGRAWSSITGR